MKQWVASSLILVCMQFLPCCGSSDSTNNGGTGGSGGSGGSDSSGGSSPTSNVSCDEEAWVGGEAPTQCGGDTGVTCGCGGFWKMCSDGKEYGIDCLGAECTCKIDGVATNTVPVGTLCALTATSDAMGPVAAACGFPL
jgi:hypothetical protein